MDVDTLPARLRGSRDWRAVVTPIHEHLLHHPEDALDIAAALDRDLDLHGNDLAVASVRHSLFSVVCRSRSSAASAVALDLGANPRAREPIYEPEYDRRRHAHEMAAVRPVTELHALLDSGLVESDPEFGLLMVHELALRRRPAPRSAAWYRQWAIGADHELAHLPWDLLDVEHRLPGEMTGFGPTPGGMSFSTVHPDLRHPVPLERLLPGLAPTDWATYDATHAAVCDLFAGWGVTEHSVRVRRSARGLAFASVPDEPSPTAHTPAEQVGLDSVLSAMFCSSVGGGAYGTGPGGAWSRLRLWRAMASILGLAWPHPIEELAERGSAWRWIALGVDDDPWFDNVAWDFWYLADDGVHVTMIAASDTD
jgi:hypothetical protein